MEQCEQSLCDLIESRMEQNLGPFCNKYIEKVAIDIAKALDYLHTSLILHGDIKSGNILVKSKHIIILYKFYKIHSFKNIIHLYCFYFNR